MAPPITSDPPFHADARRLLLPAFSPKKIAELEGEVRQLCRDRLDAMGDIEAGQTVIDAAVQYTQHIPVAVIGRMLGLPPEDDDFFRDVVHQGPGDDQQGPPGAGSTTTARSRPTSTVTSPITSRTPGTT